MTTSRPGGAARGAGGRPTFRCAECGWTAIKWVGRCGECQAWGTVEEVGASAGPKTSATAVISAAVPIGDINADAASHVPSGVGELDRVLGGGVVSGAVVLLAGEPGAGKSTLLLDAAATMARTGRRVLYITGEESTSQVKLRAERIRALAGSLFLAAETDLGQALGQVEKLAPDVLVIDSVQTLASAQVEGSAGSVSQVREVAASLVQLAKRRGMATFLIGHVTKDGSIAGPRVLEHLVDVVLQFEGERHSRLRLLRAVKNRYGPTDEVGCFDMGDAGIVGLADPSGLFLSSRDRIVPGTCVTVTLEGQRPLVTELQALMEPTRAATPRRTTSGVDSSRVAMLLAVLSKHTALPASACDAYVSTVGGARITEPASDLALALAMASSLGQCALPKRTVVVGEVGLAGEVRPVTGVDRRVAEAARLGFTKAIIPAGSLDRRPSGISVVAVGDIGAALQSLGDRVRASVPQPWADRGAGAQLYAHPGAP